MLIFFGFKALSPFAFISDIPRLIYFRIGFTFLSMVISFIGISLSSKQHTKRAFWAGKVGFIINLSTLIVGLTLAAALMLSYIMGWENASAPVGIG